MTCEQGSLCFEWLKTVPTTIVAFAVAAIAIEQWRVAKAKLKLDLFDKRYAIFLDTWKIMSEVITKGPRSQNYGLGNPFSNFIPQARFLFGKDIESYLQLAVKTGQTCGQLRKCSAMLKTQRRRKRTRPRRARLANGS